MALDLRSCRVLVTPTSYAKDDPELRTELEAAVGEVIYNPTGRPLSSTDLAELLPGCHGFIAGLDTIDRTALQAAEQLRVIARYGAGVDRVDLEAVKERGIIVTNTPGANSISVCVSHQHRPWGTHRRNSASRCSAKWPPEGRGAGCLCQGATRNGQRLVCPAAGHRYTSHRRAHRWRHQRYGLGRVA